MLTGGFSPFAIRIINRGEFDAVERNIGGEMCFIEDLSGTHAPHTEWFDVHTIVFLL